MGIWLVHRNWEQGIKLVLFGPIYSISTFSGKGWALCIFFPLFDLRCPQPVHLSYATGVLTVRHTKAVCEGNGSQAIAVRLLCQMLPAALPQYMYCDTFRTDGFCWTALDTTAHENLIHFHAWCLHPVHAVKRALPRGGEAFLKVLQQRGSLDSHLPDPGTVTQAWEHLLRVVCDIIPTHCAHYAHHNALFSVLIPTPWFLNTEHPAAAKEDFLFGWPIRTHECWRWMNPSRQCIWFVLWQKARVM